MKVKFLEAFLLVTIAVITYNFNLESIDAIRLYMPLKTIQFYGYLGVLPFILFTIAPWLSSDFSEISLKAISFYGGVIISFLGGTAWGWTPNSSVNIRFGIACTFINLVIIFFVFENFLIALVICFLAFPLFLFYETNNNSSFKNDSEYAEMRRILTLLVTICYFICLAFVFNPYT